MRPISTLLLGGGLQGLCIARSLRNNNHNVDIVTSKRDVAFYSSYFQNRYVRDSKYLTQIINLVQINHYEVLIPMSDADAAFLSYYKSRFEELGAKVPVPDKSIFDIGSDKANLMSFCELHDIGHPKTRSINSNNIESVAKYVGFPSLIKPNHSVGARGITRVNNIDELKKLYPRISSQYGACTLQQYIENQDYYYNVMMYRTVMGDTSVHAIIEIRRKYPLNAGSSCFCISVTNNRLVSMCQEVLNKMNWQGMADFDVLYDAEKDKYYIIEINPRVPASVRAGIESGVDFSEVILDDLCNLPLKTYQYKEGQQLRYLGLDLLWFIKSPKRFSYKPSWFKFTGKNLYYQDFYKDDPLPFIINFPLKFIELLKK